MARINAVSLHEHRTLEQICHLARGAGFDSLEVSRPPFFEKLTTRSTRRAFLRWARDRGLSLYGFDAWVDFDPYERWAETLEGFRRAIEFAADLELGQLLTQDGPKHLLMRGRTPSQCLEVLASFFQEVADLAAARSLKVVLEPHPDTLSMEDRFAIELIDRIARPNAGLVYDCCHYGVGQPHSYARAIEQLGARIHHVHFSDGDCRTYALHLPLGEGELDLQGIATALKEIGFKGTLTCDLYNYPLIEDGARRSAALVRRLERELEVG